MQPFKTLANWPPKIWFPLAIVLLNRVIIVFHKQYLFSALDLGLFTITPNFQVISGFFAIAAALIDWTLISVLLFFGCRLLYKSEGVFRNFFKIIGMCYLVLLVATLAHFILIFISLPPDLTTLEYNNTTNSQESSTAVTEALTSLKLPSQLIHIVGHICFVLILVPVVQTFFQIRWVQALCNVCISYAVYWILSKALLSVFSYVFSYVFLFFFPEWVPRWQPGDPIPR